MGRKFSGTKKAEEICGQIQETKGTTKSVKFAKDPEFMPTTEASYHRPSSDQKADQPATDEPPVLRKEKHPSLLPASFPDARTPGCDHFNTTLINTDMAGKSMASFHACWLFGDGTSATRTRGAAPFVPSMDCPTSPFHGLGPLVPGTTVVSVTLICTDVSGNSVLHRHTTCTLLDGTRNTQTRDPVFIPASADEVGDPSPLSHATSAEGAPSLDGCTSGAACPCRAACPCQARTQTAPIVPPSVGSSSSGCTSCPVTEPAEPQNQPKPRQLRPFYLQPWSDAFIASHRPVSCVAPPLTGRKTIVRKPKFYDATPDGFFLSAEA